MVRKREMFKLQIDTLKARKFEREKFRNKKDKNKETQGQSSECRPWKP